MHARYVIILITVVNILILHIFQTARRNTTVRMHDFYLPNDPFQDPYVGRYINIFSMHAIVYHHLLKETP